MNNKSLLILGLSFALTGAAPAQTSFPTIEVSDLPEAEITGTRSFAQSSLYGYIDGGAELYLEYGFDTLVVTEMKAGTREIKVEIYRMKDAEAAFGAFSVSRFRCNGGLKLTDYYCRSAYQLQFCKGPYYVSIINDTGSPQDQSLSNSIAASLLAEINEPSFSPDSFFPSGVTEEMMKSAVLVRGNLGIFNGVPALSETLGSAAGYTALIIRDGGITEISLRFDTEDGVNVFMEDQHINREILKRGESETMRSGSAASMICLQHLLIRVQ